MITKTQSRLIPQLLTALLAGALLAFSPGTRADDAAPAAPEARPHAGQRGEMAKERLAKLAKELDLSADQKTKLEAALKEQAETLRGLRDATPEVRRAKMKTAREEMNTKLKGILTSEQFAKWEKLRKERGSQRPRRGAGGEKPVKN